MLPAFPWRRRWPPRPSPTPIDDEAAITFGAAIYQALGFGECVNTAFQLGKSQLLLLGIPADQVPKLEVKPGCA